MDVRSLRTLCIVECYFQLTFLTCIRTRVHVPSGFLSSFLFMVHVSHPYNKNLSTQTRKKVTCTSSEILDSHTCRNLLLASMTATFLPKNRSYYLRCRNSDTDKCFDKWVISVNIDTYELGFFCIEKNSYFVSCYFNRHQQLIEVNRCLWRCA